MGRDHRRPGRERQGRQRQLLETFDERLPRYDRINAAAAAHDVRLAQTAAFETQNEQHDDAPLHLQLTENLLAFSDHAGTRVTAAQLGGMDEQRADAVLHLALSPGWRST